MKRIVSSVWLMLILLLPISQAWADEFQATIDLFRQAGESGSFFRYRLWLRGVSRCG